MKTTRMRRWIFSGGVAAALSFGVAQAFASPAEARAAELSCDPDACRSYCLSQDLYSDGVCVNVNGRMRCLCLY